jgi:hypothetical protein
MIVLWKVDPGSGNSVSSIHTVTWARCARSRSLVAVTATYKMGSGGTSHRIPMPSGDSNLHSFILASKNFILRRRSSSPLLGTSAAELDASCPITSAAPGKVTHNTPMSEGMAQRVPPSSTGPGYFSVTPPLNNGRAYIPATVRDVDGLNKPAIPWRNLGQSDSEKVH